MHCYISLLLEGRGVSRYVNLGNWLFEFRGQNEEGLGFLSSFDLCYRLEFWKYQFLIGLCSLSHPHKRDYF